MKKTKLIPFDVQKAKDGAKVVTRDGRNVRIGFFNLKGNNSYPFVGAVENLSTNLHGRKQNYERYIIDFSNQITNPKWLIESKTNRY